MKQKIKKLKPVWLMGFSVLLMSLTGIQAVAQTLNITGNVKDVSGAGMPGVSVIIEGAHRGTVTDREGNFRLQADKGQVLTINFIGYETHTHTVESDAPINIVLKESLLNIEEVVVMGYGSNIKRVDVIGAVSSVSADKIEEKSPTNALDALRGEMPGVRITSNSGAPGDDITVRVRGITTLESAGTAPLYIVDGIVVDNINNINPSDIQSIDVLKDAASAAIYGARAANGVIMVTTKMSTDGKMKIDLRYNQSFGYLSNTVPQLSRKEAYIYNRTVVSAKDKDQFNWIGDETDKYNLSNTVSNDYQDLISQVAKKSDISLSASGGSDKVRYYTSLGYVDDQGIILTSYNRRGTGTIRADYTASKVVTLRSNVRFSYEERSNISEGNTFYQAIRRAPQTLIYIPTDGKYVGAWSSYPNTNKRNPILELYERDDVTKRYQVSINEQLVLTLMPGLTFTGVAAGDFWVSSREQYNSAWTNTSYDDFIADKNSLSLTDNFYKKLSLEGYFNYGRTFRENHNFSIMAGMSAESKDRIQNTSGGTYLTNSEVRVPQATGQLNVPTRTAPVRNSIASLFTRAEYNYKSRYLFSATLRRDASSRFGKENRWGTFPAAGAGWRFTDHLKNTKLASILTDGKLRFSYGVTGNDGIGDFDAQSLYTGSVTNGYNEILGTKPNSMYGNPTLKWEETSERNYGLDLSFLSGKINFTGEYYVQKTSDLLAREPLPSELGYSETRVNFGTIQNKGIELSIAATPVRTNDWTWSTSVNWTRTRNKILKLIGDPYAYNDNWWVEEGRAAGLFYGYKQLGVYAYDVSNAYTYDYSQRLFPVFQRDKFGNVMFNSDRDPILLGYTYKNGKEWENGTDVAQMRAAGEVSRGGDVIWHDVNGDGDITADDKQVLGQAYPDWFMGWNNTVKWKNLTLNFSIYYNKGGLVYNQLLFYLSRYTDNSSISDPRSVVQGWRFQGDITDWYAPGQNLDRQAKQNNRELSDFYIENGSFLRLQSARLSYNLEKKIANKLMVSSLQVFVYGNNLLTWTNYRGYDPEINTGSILNPGLDSQKYPKKREFGFGINIGF